MRVIDGFRVQYLRAKLRDLEARRLQHSRAYLRALQSLLEVEQRLREDDPKEKRPLSRPLDAGE